MNIRDMHIFPPPFKGEVPALAGGGGSGKHRVLRVCLPPPSARAPTSPLKGGGKDRVFALGFVHHQTN